MHFFIAGVMILAATGDVRIMRFGVPPGGPRLARHLWRMCFALFIAAGSFFSIRERVARILPEPFTTAPMRALPILLVFGAMFYSLWRVRRRTLPVLLQHDSMPLTTRLLHFQLNRNMILTSPLLWQSQDSGRQTIPALLSWDLLRLPIAALRALR